MFGNNVNRIMALGVMIFVSIAFSTPQVSAETKWPQKLVVSTPASGTSIHMVGLAMGKPIEKHMSVKRWIVQPLGGPAVWAPMMEKGTTDLSIHSGPDTLNVMFGRGEYQKMGPKPFIRTLVAGHEYAFLFHTLPGKGINRLADLKDKVVYTKQPGNPMFQAMLDAQLGAAGLSEKDLKASMTMVNVREAAGDLIEGRVDAFLFPLVPSAIMQINQAKGECNFVQLTKEQANEVAATLPGFYPAVVPANSPQFKNMHEIKYSINYRTCLYGRADMDEELAYQIVKTLLEYHDEWKDAHPQARFWGPLYKNAPPYHSGAIRYYKEKGLWVEELQQAQDRLLSQLKQVSN